MLKKLISIVVMKRTIEGQKTQYSESLLDLFLFCIANILKYSYL